MLRRAALAALALAPALPASVWAQTTSDQAAALQQQIQDWLQTTLGSDAPLSRNPVQVTAAGDHFDLKLPLGNTANAPAMTGKMTDEGAGRWAIEDVRIPSPSTFHYQLPPSDKPGALGGEMTSTVTAGEQQQRAMIDTSLATPSTFTSTVKDIGVTSTASGIMQLSHIDQAVGSSTITPAGDGRVNVAVDSVVDGYTIKMTGPQAPDPIAIALGQVSLMGNATGVSRESGLEVIRTLAKINRTLMPDQPGGKPTPGPDRATSMALLAALTDLAKGVSFAETMRDMTVMTKDMAGSLKSAAFGLESKADDGKLQARLPMAAEGLTLPELGLGSYAKLIPTKLALTPTVSGVPTAALTQITQKLADKEGPGGPEIAAVFSQGPITAGIDNFLLNVAGSSFGGNVKMLISSPQVFSGTGQITAENIESLQSVLAGDPQTAQFTPLMIFLKGIGRSEQNRMVWDMVYQDGHLLVNGQDMAALTGGAAQGAPAARPKPGRPAPRPAPARP